MKPTITTILNLYKRPEYLKEQVEAIRAQNIPSTEIWLWVNEPHDSGMAAQEMHDFLDELEFDRIIMSNYNHKYHGRFAWALLAETDYVAIFDDDTIPGPNWFGNCLESYEKKPGLYGGVGIELQGPTYAHGRRHGWPSNNDEIKEVDLVGHAWFFPQEYAKYMWIQKPPTFENGEDIHFSYCLQKYGGIKTYVPPHPVNYPSMTSSQKAWEYGADNKASSNGSLNKSIMDFYAERDQQIANYLTSGWHPLYTQ